MGAKRNNLIALATAGLFLACGMTAFEASAETGQIRSDMVKSGQDMTRFHQTEIQIFTRNLTPALEHRMRRIVSLEDFAYMKTEADTLILDTRSTADFQASHLDGAVNLPLSAMTVASLAETVPDRSTRILIYSDGNIGAKAGYRAQDSSVLPLNLLTFISLYRYGYFEVYELGETGTRDDVRLGWKSAADLYATAGENVLN